MKPQKPETAKVRLHIGAFAERTGHSIHTIRWYESQGLLPRVLRGAGGKRIYTKRHLTWLELAGIAGGRASVANHGSCCAGAATVEPTLAMLLAHRQTVADKIVEWEQAMVLINQKIDFYANWKALGKQPKSG